MRSRFDEQLALLNKEMIEMGALCEEVIALASRALTEADPELAKKVGPLDAEIDQKERNIESLCLKLLLQQQPVARDLRQISAALKMITDMERIGDQAEDISEIVQFLNGRTVENADLLQEMSRAVIKMVTESVDAYVKHDIMLAEKVVKDDDIVDSCFTTVKHKLIDAIAANPSDGEYALDLMMIAKYFERIGDHAVQNFSRLVTYATYGPKSPSTNILTEAELTSMDPQQLVDRIKQLNSFKHRILYYGPNNQDELLAIINKEHQAPETLNEIPEGNNFEPLLTPETKIFIAPYEAKQIYMSQVSNKGEKFDPAAESGRQLYNEYFGGGMNSIVFQEMRESRGLAYSAWAGMLKPSYLTDPYTLRTQIATQNDKMIDAINTFNDIINNMPESEAAFKLAKDGMIARMRTDRTIKMDVIWDYISAQYLGQNVDSRIKLYNDVQNMTLQDVIDYQNKWIKGRTYTYCILGDKKELDMESLKKVGPVIELKQEDIFGY